MCMMVYVASDYPLPALAWDEDHPGFHVEEVSERDAAVKRQFHKPCVYYVGSHQGCGCGFDWDLFDGVEESDPEYAAARESRRQLSEFLALALQHQQEVELYACWDGHQSSEPEFREAIRPSDLLVSRTSFRENEWFVVS